MKTAISLPDTLFEKAERLSANLGISRSQLYARALRMFLERYETAAITARLNEVYADEQPGVDSVLLDLQIRSLRPLHGSEQGSVPAPEDEPNQPRNKGGKSW